MKALRLAALAALPAAIASAQTADDPNEGLRMSIGEAGAGSYNINWWGKSGFHYFIQHSEDLTGTWSYLPVIETGADAALSYGFTSESPRIFFRLLLTEDNGIDPYLEDYDFDGLTNQQEFDNHTDPFWDDTDHDGIIDGWEVAHGLSATASNASTDSDGDGSTDLAEYYQNTDPHALNPVSGMSITITGLADPESNSAITVGPTGAAVIRDGDNYRYWNAGQLSPILSSVAPPPPEEDSDPLTDESHTREERFWVNNQGWSVHNLISSDYFYDDGPYGWDSNSVEISTRQDSIKIINPSNQTQTDFPLTTYNWSHLWDCYAFPVYYNMRVGKVHAIDNDGFIWAELGIGLDYSGAGCGPAFSTGIYKIPQDGSSSPILTSFPPSDIKGISRAGTVIGTNSVNGSGVDYEPLFVGDGGAIFGRRFEWREVSPGSYTGNIYYYAYFPGEPALPVHEFDGYNSTAHATHFDRWNRLHGTYVEEGQTKRAVWDREQNEDLSHSWERNDYKTLILGGGKWTDHQVPPGPWEPQGGIVSWLDDDGNYHNAPTVFVPGSIAVDGNNDGIINTLEENEADGAFPGKPFTYWSNDDDDNATAPLGEGMDYLNNYVDGAEDLKDFFPVFLDIKQLLGVLPHTTEGVVYKLKHQQEALNFVYTSLTRATAFQYRTDHTGTGYGVGGSFTALDAPTAQITAAGVPLHGDFLNRVKDQDQGVILVEMRNNSERPADELAGISGRVTQPLQLVVEKDGVVIAELALPLKSLEVAVRKKGEAVPDNGVLVKTGDIIEVALDEDYFAKPNAQQNRFTWQLRQRKADGTFDEWADFGAHGKGTRFEHTTQTGGVFQIRALFNGTDEVMYKRKKSERFDLFFAYGPGGKSKPDSIGVCDTDIQIAVCREAQTFYASTTYAGGNPLPAQYGFPAYGTSGSSIVRCNIFVAHRATAAGAVVPAINGHFNEYPPLANEWAGIEDTSIWPGDPTFIEGWPIMPPDTRPQPGWIIGHPKPGDSGHCAITDYDGEGIGAGSESGTINKNYYQFWDGTSRLRRYTP